VLVLVTAAWACGDRDPTGPAPGVLHGPGPHWIDRVGFPDSTLELAGTTTVHRSASYAASPDVDPGHRDHLDLEIVAMRLEAPGVLLVAGDGVANLAPDGPLFSIGSSDERDGAPELADDLFAVAFEVTLGGTRLHGATPLPVHATIDRLPPIGSTFRLLGAPLVLVDAAGKPSGIAVASVEFVPTAMLDPR
jgi:hypothetical protein